MKADEELLAVFRAEVEEQLDRLALGLEEEPEAWDLEQLFRLAHNVKGAARIVGAAAVRDTAHALEDLFSALRRGAPRDAAVTAAARRGCDLLAVSFNADGDQAPEIASYRAAVDAVLGASAGGGGGAAAAEGNGRSAAQPPPPPREEEVADREVPRGDAETLRVGVSKLDALMSLTGEVATTAQGAEAMRDEAARLASRLDDLARRLPALRGLDGYKDAALAARRLRDGLVRHDVTSQRLSTALEDGIRNLRLVPVDNLRLLLARVLRDACGSTGREAQLRIEGGDTEVDRAVLEGLRDPLVHLLRNAVAHGIEAPAERRAAGKSERGTVWVKVRSTGAQVEIEVRDDGGGFRLEALRDQARRRLGATRARALGEQELLGLIFEAGFSTSESADAVSGRGVGLDVVKRRIEGLGGEVAVRSQPGAGAVFRLRVPLTRLTTKGLLVRVAGQSFLVPMASVERTLLVERSAVRVADGQAVVLVDGAPLPVVPLEGALGLTGRPRENRPAVVLEEGPQRRVFLVDEVAGEQDVVMQPLSWNLARLPGLSGCTVLRGENVVPTLDVPALLGSAAQARSTGNGMAAAAAERQRRVLVVDDSVTSRTLERNILASAGYHVSVANDGKQAWDLLQGDPYDMVISDVDMPAVSGIELTRMIRADRKLERTPVVLVTSLGDEEHKQRGAEAGADAYIVKGAFDQDELLKAVARLL